MKHPKNRNIKKIKNLNKYDKSGKNKFGLYECICGKTFECLNANINTGNTRSCGCLSKKLRKETRNDHGMTNTKVYRAWCSIKRRCYNQNDIQYKDYGGRGIKICNKWKNNFEAFFKDMGNPPTSKHSIERIDNNKNYTPKNCKWATQVEQCNNTRSNHYITFKNKTQSLTLWCREYNINPKMVSKRLKRGWDFEKALTTPSLRRI